MLKMFHVSLIYLFAKPATNVPTVDLDIQEGHDCTSFGKLGQRLGASPKAVKSSKKVTPSLFRPGQT